MAETASVIKLSQPVYLTAPNGEKTTEDTGIQMWPAGAELIPTQQLRDELDALGVQYEVLLEVPTEEFSAALNAKIFED